MRKEASKKEVKKHPHVYVDKRDGLIYALFTYTNKFGKRKYVRRRARNPSHAKEIYKALEAEYKQGGSEALDGARMTFNQLADYAEKHHVKPPAFADGLKMSGMKSWKDARQKLAVMRKYFGTRRIKDISSDDISAYRDDRLQTPTKRKQIDSRGKSAPKRRSIASVQRELSLLRKVLNIARRKRWIPFNPFDEGGFISNASEVKRTRVIMPDEESRLLLACESYDRVKKGETKKQSLKHLRPIIICGIDTGMRTGEMFKLVWRDVDFSGRSIRVVASNTKTEQERSVPVTERLLRELETLWNNSPQDMNGSVFGITRIKRGWASLCDKAGVVGATPHDLRHTAATRMIERKMDVTEVARILGHADVKTTYRYINLTHATVARAGAALDAFNREQEEKGAVH